MNGSTRWQIEKIPGGGYHGQIMFDSGGGRQAVVGAVGASEREALARAAVLARQIADSPIFRAVAPPGTAAAIKAIDMLARSKNVRRALSVFTGSGARRLGRVIRKFW